MSATYAQRKALGEFGERVAVGFLTEAGLAVVDRNWRCTRPRGELDIVATEGRTLVVCEVKTRSSERYGAPAEAISPDKAARLYRLGWRWLREHGRAADRVRVDIVSVLTGGVGRPVVRHVKAVC